MLSSLAVSPSFHSSLPASFRFSLEARLGILFWLKISHYNRVSLLCLKFMLVPWNYDIFCVIRNAFNWRLCRPLYSTTSWSPSLSLSCSQSVSVAAWHARNLMLSEFEILYKIVRLENKAVHTFFGERVGEVVPQKGKKQEQQQVGRQETKVFCYLH